MLWMILGCLMALVSGLLFLMGYVSHGKALSPSYYPVRTLMGWCFIWVLERLLAETYLPDRYRWVYLLVGLIASLAWYVWIWTRMKKDTGVENLSQKLDQIGRKEEP